MRTYHVVIVLLALVAYAAACPFLQAMKNKKRGEINPKRLAAHLKAAHPTLSMKNDLKASKPIRVEKKAEEASPVANRKRAHVAAGPNPPNSASICRSNADRLSLSQEDMITAAVVYVFTQGTAGPPLKKHFDGSGEGKGPSGVAVDYVTNSAAQANLVANLVGFFGDLLGCDDPQFPKYTGILDMAVVHANMVILPAEFELFNTVLLTFLSNNNFPQADQDAVAGVLEGFRSQICTRCSICHRYSAALSLTNVQLMTTLVDQIVAAEVDPSSPILRHFDGSGDGKLSSGALVDFTAGGPPLDNLKANLVSFFGAALGCTETDFPAYAGDPDMANSHKNMVIYPSDFDFFNTAFITVLQTNGVVQADLDTVSALLESFRPQICTKCSICDKYSGALSLTNVQLMTTLVDQIVAAEVDPSSPILRHFDGSGDGKLSSGALVDFTAGGPPLDNLKANLVSFFGAALGCSDAGFPAYQGDPDMANAHKNMVITAADFDFFNTAFITVLQTNGVVQEDLDTILALLETFRPQICTKCSICDRYSLALSLTNVQLMTTLVDQIVAAEVDPSSPILRHFDGSGDGKLSSGALVDFTAGGPPLDNLKANLVSFFGGALGCSDAGFPAYQGDPDMANAHKNMNIYPADFDFFNTAFITVLQTNGVVQADLDTILALLETFRPQICTRCSLCDKYSNALSLTNVQLMTTLVDQIVAAEVDPASPIRRHFDGSGDGKLSSGALVDFTAGGPPLDNLKANLVSFFGGALGCGDADFPAYQGDPDMANAHKNMNIYPADFDFFNTAFINVLITNGVTAPDAAVVLGVLNSFRPQICTRCTICDTYSAALMLSNQQLLSAVVSQTFGLLVDPASPLLGHFNGGGSGTSSGGVDNGMMRYDVCNVCGMSNSDIDFTVPGPVQDNLVTNLVSFFGGALGCGDEGFPAYTGDTDMQNVHKNMAISAANFDFFNNALLKVLFNNGVGNKDIETVGALLESFRQPICTNCGPLPTICEKYAGALQLSQIDLMTTIVGAVFAAEIAETSPIRVHFDGSGPGAGPSGVATDFTVAGPAQDFFASGLVAFFGAALGCNEAGFPAFTGEQDQKKVHVNMDISKLQFDFFNTAFLGVLEASGVELYDRQIISGVLESFRPEICTKCAEYSLSICEKYAYALGKTEQELMDTLVGAIFAAEIAPTSPIRKHFDGSGPGANSAGVAVDFTVAGPAQDNLATQLAGFFGAAIGCTEVTPYTGEPDQKIVHQNMLINDIEFDFFVQEFLGVLTTTGVEVDDVNTVATLLESFRGDVVTVAPTICEKYSAALSMDQVTLMNTIVVAVVTAETAPTSPILMHFDGTGAGANSGGVATNFTAGGPALDNLVASLVAFFGGALGCNAQEFPAYVGEPDQKIVHQNMLINDLHYDFFVDEFITILAGFGVDMGDQTTIRTVLELFRADIVTQEVTICEKYANALSLDQVTLMETIVDAVVAAEVAPTSPILIHFDGSGFGNSSSGVATNFTAGGPPLDNLKAQLVAFFGKDLGCSTQGTKVFPAYTGELDQKIVHQNMKINDLHFDFFVQEFIGVLAASGVDDADQTTITTYLNGFRNDIVTQPVTICEKYANALSLDQVTLMTTIVTAIFAAETAPTSPILVHFDGSGPGANENNVATDFTVAGPAQDNLVTQLVAFFGAALGCSTQGSVVFPTYTGNPDQQAVHANMQINDLHYDFFVDEFIATLATLGVDMGDQTFIRTVLESFRSQIVTIELTLCEKYASALMLTQEQLMIAIVTDVVNAEVAPGSPLIPHFDGSGKGKGPGGVATDFTAGGAPVQGLIDNLVAFFGAPLGCNDATFPAYTGIVDQAVVHANMDIDSVEFEFFITAFLDVLNTKGVTQKDQTTIGQLLETFRGDVCTSCPPPSLCEKYATALSLSQIDLMTTLVDQIFAAEIDAASPIRRHFDGSGDGAGPDGVATDFTVAGPAQTQLATDLVTFFGQALGCNDVTFPTYTGNPDMKQFHSKMKINAADFDFFNTAFLGVLEAAGVDEGDRGQIGALLESFRADICTECTLCEKYSSALMLTQEDLLRALVLDIFAAETAPGSPLLPHFNGGGKGTSSSGQDIDYTVAGAAQTELVDDLVAFFGAALGCNDPNFPPYTGVVDQAVVHQNMDISASDFDFFVSAFASVLTAKGVSAEDVATISGVLETFRPAICTKCNEPPSICDKYSAALSLNNDALMEAVVLAVFAKEVDAASLVLQHFDGSGDGAPPSGPAVDFTVAGAAQSKLVKDLKSFFGNDLGCSDGTLAPYTGSTDMKAFHANMKITGAQYTFFVDAFVSALADLGVDQADQDTIETYLNGFKDDICTLCAPPSICDKYSDALSVTNDALMETVVLAVFGKEVAPTSPVKKHFDGSGPGAPPSGPAVDFTVAGAAQTKLVEDLKSFFGRDLGCSDGTLAAYTGSNDMKAFHAKMTITEAEFTFFVSAFIEALGEAGVDQADQTFIETYLNGFKDDVCTPCTKSICDKYSVALSVTNDALMETIVLAVFGKEVAPDSLVLPHFDGSGPGAPPSGPAVDFTVAGPAQTKLVQDLKSFFGNDLGCSDGTLAAYTGSTDMKAFHAKMAIDETQYAFFVSAFLKALEELGVDQADRTFIETYLNSFKDDVCTLCDGGVTTTTLGTTTLAGPPTICEKYATLLSLSQVDLMKAIVGDVFALEIASDSIVRKHFDGSGPGANSAGVATDFTVAGPDQDKLALDLVAFFGETLGCSEAGFPQYTGEKDQKIVHQRMAITEEEFDFFNKAFETVLQDKGVEAVDILIVTTVLESQKDQICTKCEGYVPPDGLVGESTNPPVVDQKVSESVSGAQSTAILLVVGLIIALCFVIVCTLIACFLRERGRRKDAQDNVNARDVQLDSLYGQVDEPKSTSTFNGGSNGANGTNGTAPSMFTTYGAADRGTMARPKASEAGGTYSAAPSRANGDLGNADYVKVPNREASSPDMYVPLPPKPQSDAPQDKLYDTVRVVRSAIRQGVPQYNDGEKDRAFNTYRAATQRAMENMQDVGKVQPEVFGAVAQRFMQALQQAEAEDPTTGAWTLRANFDNFLELATTTTIEQAAAGQNEGLAGYDYSVRSNV